MACSGDNFGVVKLEQVLEEIRLRPEDDSHPYQTARCGHELRAISVPVVQDLLCATDFSSRQ